MAQPATRPADRLGRCTREVARASVPTGFRRGFPESIALNSGMIQRLILSFALGALSLFVLLLGAEPFDEPGPTPVVAYVSGGFVVLMYSLFAQFWVAPRGKPGLRGKVATLVAMMVAVVGWIALIERGQQTVLAVLIGACAVGGTVGAALAGRAGCHAAEPAAADRRDTQRRRIWTASGLAYGVAAVLLVVVIPLAQLLAAEAYPPKASLSLPFVICAALHVVVATMLVVSLRRLPERGPTVDHLVVASVFAFVLGTAILGAAAACWSFASVMGSALPVTLLACVLGDAAATVMLFASALGADADTQAGSGVEPKHGR